MPMKPYGLPRLPEFEFPDVGDIRRAGFKSSAGKFPGPSGDFRPYSRGPKRRATRRYWARRARAEGRAQCLCGVAG